MAGVGGGDDGRKEGAKPMAERNLNCVMLQMWLSGEREDEKDVEGWRTERKCTRSRTEKAFPS